MQEQQEAERKSGWWAWIAVSSFYLFQFILRVSPVALESDLIEAFHIDAGSLGTLGALYYIGYAGMQIPLGVAFDTWGVRRVLLCAATTCVVGALLSVLAPSFWIACLGRLLLGMGAASGFLGSMKIASARFRPALFATLVGLENLVGVVGALLGGGPLRLLVEALGWRGALGCVTLLGVLSLYAIFAAVRDASVPQPISVWRRIRTAAGEPALWMTALMAAALYSPITVIADLWGAPYLRTAFDIPASWSSSAVSVIYIGYGIGCLGVGAIAGRCQNLQRVLMCSCLALGLSLSVLLGEWCDLQGTLWLMGLMGILGSAVVLAYPYVCRMMPKGYGGTVSAMVNIGAMLGGCLLQPAVGRAVAWSWSGTTLCGMPQYATTDYQTGFAVLLGALALAATAFYRSYRAAEQEIEEAREA